MYKGVLMKKYSDKKLRCITALIAAASAVFIYGCSFSDVVKDGTPGEISIAIKKGADVNEKTGTGETPLICAIRYNKNPYETAMLLIESGADVNGTDSIGTTPLHAAVIIPDGDQALKLIRTLIERGAKVNVHGSYDSVTPLMPASTRSKDYQIAEFLISKGADVKAENIRKETALHYAASINNNTKIIELLIKNGADVNAGTPSFTPLHRAAYMGASANIAILIRNGASINVKGNLSDSKTALETAIDGKQFETARMLAENGADINTESYYNYQPFRYRNNRQTYTQKLVQVDLDTIRFERMTPLHRAVTHNNLPFVEYLLSRGAKTDKDAHFGGFPLDFALFLNYYDIAEVLVKYKAGSLYADLYLSEAIEAEDLRKTELLLRIGADLKRKDYKDDTPLHTAAETGNVEIIKLLLKHGADKTAKNRNGKTPADAAVNEEVRSLLFNK